MIELITDTTHFEDCGCLEELRVGELNYILPGEPPPPRKEVKVWFTFDTNAPSSIQERLTNDTEPLPELVIKALTEAGFPYLSCPQAGLSLKNMFERYHICNFPTEKFSNLKPFASEAIISGIVYGPSWTTPGPILGDHVGYEFFMTSFKIPRKYLLEGDN